jgi:hypothetical protein
MAPQPQKSSREATCLICKGLCSRYRFMSGDCLPAPLRLRRKSWFEILSSVAVFFRHTCFQFRTSKIQPINPTVVNLSLAVFFLRSLKATLSALCRSSNIPRSKPQTTQLNHHTYVPPHILRTWTDRVLLHHPTGQCLSHEPGRKRARYWSMYCEPLLLRLVFGVAAQHKA